MLGELCERLGAGEPARSVERITAELAEAVPFYAGLTFEEIGGRGVRWQDREAASALPAEELPTAGLPEPPAAPEGLTVAVAGTLWPAREVEHSPSLSFLAATPHAELSPEDARELGVESGAEVELTVAGQQVTATARVRTGVPARQRLRRPARHAPRRGRRDRGARAGRCAGGGLLMESVLVMIVKSIVIFAFILQIVPLILLLERKLLGRFQSRIGPNRVGPKGLMQPLADVFKLLSKEASAPATAVPWMMAIAPVISIVTAVATLAIVPFGPYDAWGGNFGLYGMDVSIGLLYFFAFGSLGFYGLVLGGWASGSKYSFLGAMRAAAQLISYEVALGLSLLGVAMTAGSLSLVDIVDAQDHMWYVVPQFVGFCIFLVAGFAETARAPFDLPEGDAEIVGGYNTEYGGMRFGSFFMAEYIEVIIISAIAAACFLGGWHGPGPVALAPLWMLLKLMLGVIFFIWIRASLPRLRYDQLMSFGWKVLLPLATLNVLVTAVVLVAT